MSPTLYLARVEGHGTDAASVHTRRDRAVARAAHEVRAAWIRRHGYSLPAELSPEAVVDRGVAEGWRVRVDEVEVDLP